MYRRVMITVTRVIFPSTVPVLRGVCVSKGSEMVEYRTTKCIAKGSPFTLLLDQEHTVSTDVSNLERDRQPMPDFVREALEEHGLMGECRDRPAYQQNDDPGWIKRAKRDSTKQKRLQYMLEALAVGGVYMGRDHPPSRSTRGEP